MPRRRAMSRALSSEREAMATTSVCSPFCIAGITFCTPMWAVLNTPMQIFCITSVLIGKPVERALSQRGSSHDCAKREPIGDQCCRVIHEAFTLNDCEHPARDSQFLNDQGERRIQNQSWQTRQQTEGQATKYQEN